MKEVNYSTLESSLKSLLDSISKDQETVIVNCGKSSVAMISLEEYNSWQETEYLFSTKTNRDRLLKSMDEVEIGKVIHHALIED